MLCTKRKLNFLWHKIGWKRAHRLKRIYFLQWMHKQPMMKRHSFTCQNFLTLLCATAILFIVSACKKEIKNNLPPSPFSLTPKPFALTDHCKGFYEYLPEGYLTEGNTKYPLMIFIHGAGEVGTDSAALTFLLKNGPLKHVKNGSFPTSFSLNKQTYKFIIIAPQFTSGDSPYPDEMDKIIEYAKKNYRVDASRIYMTGLSFGGAVCWNYVGASPVYARKIAAMVAIGAYLNEFRSEFAIDAVKAKSIASSNVPIWSTHNKGDDHSALVWVTDAYKLLNNYRPSMVPSPKLTIFDADGHEGWTTTYDPSFKENNMNIYQWMLQYHR